MWVGVVRRRHRIDLGERVAVRAQAVLDELLGGGDQLVIEGLAGLHQQQLLQLRLRHDERAGELHLGDLEDIAFLEVHGDEDVVLLRRDGHLSGLDLEVRVAAVHVVVAQLLQVALQGLARVAVVLLVPGHPVGRLQLEGVQHFFLLVGVIADEVDLADLGALAFLDLDLDLTRLPVSSSTLVSTRTAYLPRL